jgi:hypothetical protein
MPDQPGWIDRIEQIAEEVQASSAPVFDRAAIERLFEVRRRQAIVLMHRMGGYQAGKTFLVDRQALLRFLRDPQREAVAEVEARRFASLLETLGRAKEERHFRRIPVPATARVYQLEFGGLPEGIDFEPGELRIRFNQPHELLEKLFALSQALANDYETFEQAWARASQP